jgi:hypothetical protein
LRNWLTNIYVQARVDGRCDLTDPQRAAEQAPVIYQRLNLAHPGAHHKNVQKARDLVFEVREAALGHPPERPQSWTPDDHWSMLINQDKEWQDASDRRLRIVEMDPKYCANVRAFILRQADDLLEEVLTTFSVIPEALGSEKGTPHPSWMEGRPLLIAGAQGSHRSKPRAPAMTVSGR